MAESAAELDMLQLEFVSQVADDCARLIGAYFAANTEEGDTLKKDVTEKVPKWNECARELQTREQVLRARTPLLCEPGSPAPSRKSPSPKRPVFGVPLETLPVVPGFRVPLILFDTTETLRTNPECLLFHIFTLLDANPISLTL